MPRRSLSLIAVFVLVSMVLFVGTPPFTRAQPHEPVNLKLYAMSLGGQVYVLSFALTEIINKHHPWLRVECVEGRGSQANLKLLADNAASRKDTFIFTHEMSNQDAREGAKPFKAPYTGARAIAAMAGTTVVLMTLDKNIKGKEDFAGKRFMTMRPGTTNAILHNILLNDVWGIGDKVKLSYGTFQSIKDALKDGLVDIGCQPITGLPGSFFAPIPSLTELMSTKDVYFINISREDVKAIAKKAGKPVHPSIVPAGALGPKQPTEVHGYIHSLGWWADQEMDEGIVYEITKTIYEYADKFEEYAGISGKFVSKQTMGMINVPEEHFHAGALKFYREKGMKVGEKE